MGRQMRILFVTENMTARCGANVNILLTLIKRMKPGIVADVLYKENQQKPIDPTKAELVDTCLGFDFSEGESLTKFQNQHEWRAQSAVRKLGLLLSHPIILRDMIDVKYFDSHRTKCRYVKEIERACERNKFDAVIGLCAPYYIAQAVAEAKISSLKAIIQLDPYTYNYTMPSFLTSVRRKIESRVVKKLHHIFAVSYVNDELLEKGIIDANKSTSFMVPGILFDEVYEPSVNTCSQNSDLIHFVFVGQFYDHIRNPRFLLDLFCNLPQNYVLHIYGGGSESVIDRYRDKLGERLIHHGWVSSDIAKHRMYEADFLVNVNNSITNQMASKLFEYIGTGKPIINICKSIRCPSISYVSNYDNCLSIVENDTIDNEKVEDFCAFVNKAKGTTVCRGDVLTTFYNCTDKCVVEQIISQIIRMREENECRRLKKQS